MMVIFIQSSGLEGGENISNNNGNNNNYKNNEYL